MNSNQMAQITVSDNFGHNVKVTVLWDGTENGKVASRRKAHEWAKEHPDFIPAGFVSKEIWGY